MTEPMKSVVVELHPNLTVQRNPGQIQNVKVIVDADGHLKVLPEMAEDEACEPQSAPSSHEEMCEDLPRAEQLNAYEHLNVSGDQTCADNPIAGVLVKVEPVDTYGDPASGIPAIPELGTDIQTDVGNTEQCWNSNETYQWIKARQTDVCNTQQCWNTGEKNHCIKDEPVDFVNTKQELKIINTYHMSERLFKEENDTAESNCVGERIYLPYNIPAFDTDEETDSLPEAVEPVLSEEESYSTILENYAVLTFANGKHVAFPIADLPKVSKDQYRIPVINNETRLDDVTFSKNSDIHPCVLKKNIWAPKKPMIYKSNCEQQEKEMLVKKRPRKCSKILLRKRIKQLTLAIIKKKSFIEGKIQKQVDLEVAAIIHEKAFSKREDEKRKRLNSSDSQHCHICKTKIDVNGMYLDCELCSVWFHGLCVGITDRRKYEEMEAFLCEYCKEQQDSTYKQLHCICKTPLDDGKFYVGCDQCQGWFHGTCVGVTEEMANKMDTYICPLCLPKKKAKIKKHLLNDTDYERLWDLVRNLQSHKMAKTLNATLATAKGSDNGLVETQTIDLSLVEHRMVLKHYKTLSDFVQDMTAMFQNCRGKNPNNSAVYQCAEILESFFVQKLKSLRIK